MNMGLGTAYNGVGPDSKHLLLLAVEFLVLFGTESFHPALPDKALKMVNTFSHLVQLFAACVWTAFSVWQELNRLYGPSFGTFSACLVDHKRERGVYQSSNSIFRAPPIQKRQICWIVDISRCVCDTHQTIP